MRALFVGLALLSANVGAAATPRVDLEIAIVSCRPDASTRPTIRIADIDKTFATVQAPIKWSNTADVWTGTTSIPEGHYIVEAGTEHCSGRNAQWVAIPGSRRHVTITLNEIKVVSVDEDMYANAVFGRLPLPGAYVEVMRADSLLGEQTRRPLPIDGDSFQIGHLEPGNYIVLITFGGVRAAKTFTIPRQKYGATIDVSMTADTAAQLVRAEQVGSGFVKHPWDVNDGYGYHETFRLGAAEVDGWNTMLSPPADYSPAEQRISRHVVRAIEAARVFLSGYNSVPTAFRSLDAWNVGVFERPDGMVVRLTARDGDGWGKSVRAIGKKMCPDSNPPLSERHQLRLFVADSGGAVLAMQCP